jgi:hypothetical protein
MKPFRTIGSSLCDSRSAAVLGAIGICLGAVTVSATAANGLGLTWGKYSHDASLGVDRVGIYGTGNPYGGDTSCSIKLPVLCVNVDGSPRPNYAIPPAGGSGPAEFYSGWLEGHIATTKPIKGSILTSASGPETTSGDQQCIASFGTGWRMAEWHDGQYILGMDATHFYGNTSNSSSPWASGVPAHGGHTFFAFGNVRSDKRYWVTINDQPGNCWNP